jgi:hypothetical protein
MRHRINVGNWRSILGTTALAAGLSLFAGAGTVKADDECQERIVRADHRLHEAIERHGYESREAERGRIELREARQYCWEHSHRWWDVEGSRWHSDRDWDDHDHDRRDRDRDHDRDHDRDQR